ncbi:MAG: hypothetical protein ACRERS_04670 [Methylococcales bacterium]
MALLKSPKQRGAPKFRCFDINDGAIRIERLDITLPCRARQGAWPEFSLIERTT